MRTTLVSLALVAGLLAGCGTVVTNPVTGQQERSVMDEAAEIAEGRKAHAQVIQQYGVYQNAKVQAYVNTVGQKLAKASHRSHLQWHFTVLDSPEVNAFALPGGYVYVTRGIMAYMESEAELAGVLGHEIGHVTARHGAQRATRQQTAGLGVLAAGVLGAVLESQGVTGAGRVANQVSQGVAAGLIASYGREQELQADSLGAEYLSRTQYDPRAMIDVITVLKDQERFAADAAKAEGRVATERPSWLASHPSNDRRLQDIRAQADKYSGTYGDEGRQRYLRTIDGMTFGESRAQGFTRGRHFYHEPLGIALTAPPGWKLQNSEEAITVLNVQRDAALVVQPVPASAGSTHDEILRSVFKPTQGTPERTTLNGLSATRFSGARQNPQGQTEGVNVTVVTGPTGQHYLLRQAGKDSAALYRARPLLRETEASFRPLTPADRAAARPWTLATVPFPKGGFAQLGRESPLETRAEEHLRLINGVYGEGELQTGQLVKVVTAR